MSHLTKLQKTLLILIGFFYVATCLISVFTVTPAMDTLYYWDWGRYLALSYFDGPPAVAYIFSGFTYLFGSGVYAVNALSILSSFLITLPIYALAKKIFDARVAFFSVCIWLLTLFTFQKYTIGFSYDTPVTFFWALSAYYFYCGYKDDKDSDFYLAGVSAGLMMLSKYTGILLFLSFFIVMIFSRPYRNLLKKPAIYLSGLLSFIIFSPVLFWNYLHAGGSALFQFNHGFLHKVELKQLFIYLGILIGNYNYYFLIFIWLSISQFKTIISNDKLSYLWYLSITTLIVFACVAPFSVKYNWMETFYITAVILIANSALQTPRRLNLFICFLCISAFVLFGFSIGIAMESHKKVLHNRYAEQKLYLQLNHYAFKNDPIFVTNYNDGAGVDFYLKRHPHAIAFNLDAHQYGYWGKPVVYALQHNHTHDFYLITEPPFTLKIPANCHPVFKALLPLQDFPNQLWVDACTYIRPLA